MSSDLFFVSDHHFSHANFLNFKKPDGHPCRPFNNVHEMDETMIQNHNSVVKPSSKVYFLGDVCFKSWQRMDEILPRMNGKKRLILGNHDHFPIEHYARHFQKIMSWRQFKQFKKPFICCHYPLHKANLTRGKTSGVHCVHGHVHQHDVKIPGTQVPDPQYVNVCVEKINYTPVELEELYKMMHDF